MAAGAARREVASEESERSMGSPDSDPPTVRVLGNRDQRETPPLFNCPFRMGPRFEINDQMVSIVLLDRWTRKPKDGKMMGPAWAPVSVMLRWVHGAFCGTTVGFRAKSFLCQKLGSASLSCMAVQSRPFNVSVFPLRLRLALYFQALWAGAF